ncbi:immunity repressor [Gordonia phage Skog]|uniref:Immunity repressor n=1 Tax=Gordonia phage Skog TaxID=2704033 RepID=A0A6G6XJE8_9CAUD|nr:transcriptional regulator [Gordonia phage Skog]QIG58218.1 immunity repressor [Gordonia phage Skog]
MITDRKVGKRLYQLRRDMDRTQKQVAKVTGIPQPTLSKIERGHSIASRDALERLCLYYGVPLSSVTSDDIPKPSWEPGGERNGILTDLEKGLLKAPRRSPLYVEMTQAQKASLAEVSEAAEARHAADLRYKNALLDAYALGLGPSPIATAAGVTTISIIQMIRRMREKVS